MRVIKFIKEKLTNQFKSPQKYEAIIDAQIIEDTDCDHSIEPMKNSLITDSNDDLSSNLMASVFAIIEERRKMLMIISDYKERLANFQSIEDSILKEKKQLECSLEDRDQQIVKLQIEIEGQQRKYEELLTDHNSLRVNELNERVKLQQKIKELQADYESLSIEFRQLQGDKDQEAISYTENIRKEVEKYNHLQMKYDSLSKENKALMEKIAAFAKQISSFEMLNTFILPNYEEPGINKSN
ncbi:MAG: hypothetical protein ACOX47_12730 [Bacillota bacterium]|jgi:chromosome segregation ATPase